MAARSRPLSPHLQIYKFTLTMTTSIVHRGTGIAMYFGTLLIVLWVGAAALGEGPLGVMNAIFGFWLVQIILFLATWALFQHLLGGIRHFVWDLGFGFKANEREALTWGALIGGIALTVLIWIIAYAIGGVR